MEDQEQERYVSLDVGGTHFKTSLSTLLSGDTMLSAMFSGRIPPEKDGNGMIFIDRDGKHFNRILNFLRDGVVALPETDTEVEELKKEAQYYCIEDLVKLCDSDNRPSKMKEKQKRENRKRKFEKLDRMTFELSISNSKKWGSEYYSMCYDYSQNQRYANAFYNAFGDNSRPAHRPAVPVIQALPVVQPPNNDGVRFNNGRREMISID